MNAMPRLAPLALVAIFVLVLSGCPKAPPTSSPTATPSGRPQAPDEIVLAYSLSTLSHQFFVDMLAGVEAEAEKQGAKLIHAEAGADAGKQLSDVEDLLQKDPSAMMITPQDSDAIKPAVTACNDRGVPVVIIDIGASGGKVDSFIISDNYQGGCLAGEYIAERVAQGARVSHIQCQLGAANARKRGEGFTAVMAEKGIQVYPPQPADSRRDLAMTVMENLLETHSRIDAVFAENDPMAMGAVIAVKNRGLSPGSLLVVGFNGDPEALDAVRAGDMAATVMQFPYDMGVAGVEQAAKLARGEEAEAQVDVPVELVTGENIDEFEGYRRKSGPQD